jgi:small subunit ribosomal protein S16
MLVIRLQRTGRSGHAQFRFVVQDKRFSPSKGRVVAYLGNYDPHTKRATLDSEKASQYLENGAQPSDRVAILLQKEGIKLPAWVKTAQPKERAIRNPEKRRSTAPAQPAAEEPVEAANEPAAETPAESGAAPPEAPAEETKAQEEAAPSEEQTAPAADETAASDES